MKEINYKPECEDMRKRLIGFKLGLISKKRNRLMQEERKQAGILDKSIDRNIKNTEQLLASFMPNVQRAMQKKQEDMTASMKR